MNSLNIVHFNPDGIRGRQTNILNYIDQENTHSVTNNPNNSYDSWGLV